MNDKVITIDPNEVELHEISRLHRLMDDKEFQALKLDIEFNGQLVPVILYKNKIVDGRHRRKALIELGSKEMKAIKIKNNLTLDEVRNKIIGSEIRRGDNVMQKSIRAYLWMTNTDGANQEDASIKFGVSRPDVSNAKQLYNAVGKDMIQKIYQNGYFMIQGKRVSTMKRILKWLKQDDSDDGYEKPTNEGLKTVFEQLYAFHKIEDIVSITKTLKECQRLLKKSIDS